VEGTVVRVNFTDNKLHEISVNVLDSADTVTGTYTFEVGNTEPEAL
jgi:hypothetical protein